MGTVRLEIVTPERKLLSVDCDEVQAPGANGLFGVRPGHTPFLTALVPGPLLYRVGEREELFAVGEGFAEVGDDRVVVLAENAEAARDIDLGRAQRAQEQAKTRMAQLRQDEAQYRVEAARVHREAARVAVAKRVQSK